MLSKNIAQDLPAAILGALARRLPRQARPWAEAMLGEVDVIADRRARLVWVWSGIWGIARIWARSWLRASGDKERKPATVLLIALYHALFACVLLVVLIRQIPLIKAPWSDAVCPLLFFFLIALLPGAIAIGLFLLDDAARWMAVFFSMAHALGNLAWMTNMHVGWRPLTVGRIGMDLLMIGILLLPSTRRVFRPPQIRLGLLP